VRGSVLLVAPQGFTRIENKQVHWIVRDRTQICTHTRKGSHTPISRASPPASGELECGLLARNGRPGAVSVPQL
jgi:hypothetical protein